MKSADFWRAVRELAAMAEKIPPERRRMSLVLRAIAEDVLPGSAKSRTSDPDNDVSR